MFPFRLLAAALLLQLATQLVTAMPAAAAAQQCGGSDLLAGLAREQPDVHRTILDHEASTIGREAVLWRVEKPGVQPSHLMGTMHVADPRISRLSKAAQDAIAAARTIAIELTGLSDSSGFARAMMKSPQLYVFTDGRRLDGLLSPDEFAVLEATAVKAGLATSMLPAFRPWFLFTLLALPECERVRATRSGVVLDSLIEQTAKGKGKAVVGLETIEEQMTAMSAIPESDQLAMLRATLKTIHMREDTLETMVGLYLKRQIGAIWPMQLHYAKTAGVDREQIASFHREVIDKRNRRMLERSLPLLDQGGAFIAVGALHNVGPEGLVALYRNAGYTVSPVE